MKKTTSIVIMVVLSVLAGFLSTMNIWAVKSSDVRIFHLNDIYMVLLMTAWMSLFMVIYHGKYSNRWSKTSLISIAICSTFVALFIYLIRTQTFVNDSQFVKGMIPHHSMAILMAKKIKEKSKDEKILKFADDIIVTQTKEIEFLKNLGY